MFMKNCLRKESSRSAKINRWSGEVKNVFQRATERSKARMGLAINPRIEDSTVGNFLL